MINYPGVKLGINLGISVLLVACAGTDSQQRAAAQARAEVAIAYLQNHNYSAAKMSLDKALDYDANYYLPYLVLARYYQQIGEVTQAEHAYQDALKRERKQGNIYNNYGAFLCQQGKFEQAFQQFSQTLSLSNYHNQTQTYQNIALCAYQAKDKQHLQDAMNKLSKLSPKSAEELKAILN